jgi:hypothetical protein
VGKAFIVAQIEVSFRAIIGDEDLAVLEGGHRPGIDVQIRIKFLQTHFEAAGFKEAANRSCRESFTKRRDNTAGHKDILCRHLILVLFVMEIWLGMECLQWRLRRTLKLSGPGLHAKGCTANYGRSRPGNEL